VYKALYMCTSLVSSHPHTWLHEGHLVTLVQLLGHNEYYYKGVLVFDHAYM